MAHYWEDPEIMSDEDVKKWRIALRVAKWSDSDLCKDVMPDARWIYSNNIGYDGASSAPDVKVLGRVGKGQFDAQHMHEADSLGGRGAVVFVSYFPENMLWEKILHEAAHHAGKNEADAKKAESCAERDKEKENEDDDDDDGGGGGGGGGTSWNPGETCTTTTEWVFAGYRNCTHWTGPSGLPDLNVCFEEIWIPTEVEICS